MSMRKAILLGLIAILSVAAGLAQFRRGGRRGFWGGASGPIIQTEGGEVVNEDTVRTARETAPHSVDLPAWTNSPGFPRDTFTFARILYHSLPGRPTWLGWVNDYPDGDLNLSYRLQQLTSLRVDPDGRVLRLTDPDLHRYPLVFASQAGGMDLTDAESRSIAALPEFRRCAVGG